MTRHNITIAQLAVAIPALILAFAAAHDSTVRLAFLLPLVLILAAFAWQRLVRRS